MIYLFDIETIINENKLSVNLKGDFDGYKYSYHLYFNKEVIAKQENKDDVSVDFEINKTGEYYVKVFLKDKNVIFSIDSLPIYHVSYKERMLDTIIEKYKQLLTRKGKQQVEIDALLAQKKIQIADKDYFGIPFIILSLTYHCVLNCKHCTEMQPLRKQRKQNKHVPFDMAVTYLDNVLSAVDEIITLSFTTGEVFLYPHLKEILKKYSDNNKICNIELTTTGLVQPDDELVLLLKHEKISINLTEYSYNLSQAARFVTLMEEHNVDLHIHTYAQWFACEITDYGLTKEQMRKAYNNCVFSYNSHCKKILAFEDCITSCGGFATSMLELNIVEGGDKPLRFSDYKSPSSLKEGLRKFYMIEYTEACRYCSIALENPKRVERAEQSGGNRKRSNYTIVGRSYLKRLVDNLNDSYKTIKKQKEENQELKQKVKELEEWFGLN